MTYQEIDGGTQSSHKAFCQSVCSKINSNNIKGKHFYGYCNRPNYGAFGLLGYVQSNGVIRFIIHSGTDSFLGYWVSSSDYHVWQLNMTAL